MIVAMALWLALLTAITAINVRKYLRHRGSSTRGPQPATCRNAGTGLPAQSRLNELTGRHRVSDEPGAVQGSSEGRRLHYSLDAGDYVSLCSSTIVTTTGRSTGCLSCHAS
jgi:hypothetical protein